MLVLGPQSFRSTNDLVPTRRRIMRFSIQYSTIGELLIHNIRVPSLYLLVALLWYDYALTWTREVRYFWKRPFTLSTAMYILCRYGMVSNVLYALALAQKLPTMRVSFVEAQGTIAERSFMSLHVLII